MVCRGNSPAASPRLPNRNILVERRGAFNGRFVNTSVLVDVVGSSITSDGAFVCSTAETNLVLYDVVLDKGVSGPAVHGEEDGAGAGLEITGKGDVPSMMLTCGIMEKE